ncbi:MAG: phosphate ABC transporter permease PstA [Actinobacteria bacterium]|nr:phosphate ABC transporter permease PstA [Actinomycetota bacterium]
MAKEVILSAKAISIRAKRRKLAEKVFVVIAFISLLAVLFTLIQLLSSVFVKGLKWLDLQFLTSPPSRFPEKTGIYPALIGSTWLIVLTIAIAVPIGVASAIFLEEYSGKSRISRSLDIIIGNLAGIPSIIYGIFGLAIFVRYLHLGRSILAGALTLSLLILPVIIISTREAIRAVPRGLREISYALGATKWQTIRYVVLPVSSRWIATSVILSIARVIGETAPLIAIGALSFIMTTPRSVFDPFTALTIQIYTWLSKPQQDFKEIAAAGIIVLLLLFGFFMAIGSAVRYRAGKFKE